MTYRVFKEDFNEIVSKYEKEYCIITNVGINEENLTYRQVSDLIDRFLLFFENMGLKPGDTILSLLPNSAEAIICFLATMKGGFGYAPLACSSTERELEKWISLIKPKMYIKMDSVNFNTLNLPERKNVINIKCDNSFDWLPNYSSENTVLNLGEEARLYLSTSGTTGEAKAMVLDSNVLWSSGCAFSKFHGLNNNELKFWNYLPMSYLGGLFNLTLIPIAVGGSIVVTEPFSGKTLLSFWQTVERFEINSLWLVPTIVNGLLKISSLIKSSKHKEISAKVKICFVGTAPITKLKKVQFEDTFGVSLLENYGLSETTFLTSETELNVNMREDGSVGEELPYAKLKFVEQEKGSSLYEIKVKTPYMFKGYLLEDGEEKIVLDNEGFLATGDIGYLNEEGILIINGRKQDVIKKGGLFISLKEIEVVVEKLDYIDEVAAVRINHDFYGESYELYVIPSEENNDVADRLNKWLHENFIDYKWPEKIYIRSHFPKTASQKIIKIELRGDEE